MDFEEFKDSVCLKWQKRILTVSRCGFFLILAFELVIFAVFYKMEQLYAPPFRYFIERVLFPSSLNFLAVLLGSKAAVSNRFTVAQKNFIVSFFFFIICLCVSVFHGYFNFLLVTTGIPIVVCSVFADKKLLRRMFLLCLAAFACSAVSLRFDTTRLPSVDFITTVLCSLIFIFLMYMVSNSLVTYQIEQLDFIFEVCRQQSDLIQELKMDPLTKLYNKFSMNGAMTSAVKKFRDGLIHPHIVLIDIDGFKNVNDTFGHLKGDRVLAELAGIIKFRMKGSRRAFRYGGDEFVLLFENENPEYVAETVENIRKDFSLAKFDFAPDAVFTISVGISKLQPQWNDTTWFNAADSAMYKAKESGRNKVSVAD